LRVVVFSLTHQICAGGTMKEIIFVIEPVKAKKLAGNFTDCYQQPVKPV
jgi:hypothetical protein